MNEKKPAYLILYEELRREITQGDWKTGGRLPSRRQIARERGVSAVTADHSYELLCQEGYIESRPRSGFYVCYRQGDSFFLSQNQESARPAARYSAEKEHPVDPWLR